MNSVMVYLAQMEVILADETIGMSCIVEQADVPGVIKVKTRHTDNHPVYLDKQGNRIYTS